MCSTVPSQQGFRCFADKASSRTSFLPRSLFSTKQFFHSKAPKAKRWQQRLSNPIDCAFGTRSGSRGNRRSWSIHPRVPGAAAIDNWLNGCSTECLVPTYVANLCSSHLITMLASSVSRTRANVPRTTVMSWTCGWRFFPEEAFCISTCIERFVL